MSKKITVLILIAIIALLIFLLDHSFETGLFSFMQIPSLQKKLENNPAEVDKLKKKLSGQVVLPAGESWEITYYVPSCYQDTGPAPLTIARTARIYWKQLKSEESIRGTYVANDNEIIYTGQLAGRGLELNDSKYSAKIKAEFNEQYSFFDGKYTINNNLGWTGCEGLSIITGNVYGKPVPQ